MFSVHRSIRRHDPLLKRRRIILFAAITAFIGVMFYLVSWTANLSGLRINSIAVLGTNVIDKNLIRKITQKKLEGSYLLVFPKENIFLYPKKEISKLLIEKEPRIKELQIETPLRDLTTLKISIVERNSNLAWCISGEEKECFLLDDDGIVYASAEEKDPSTLLFIENSGTGRTPLGHMAVDPRFISPILSFIDFFEDDLRITRVVLLDEGDYSLETSAGVIILFNKDDDLNLVMSNLFTFLSSDIIKEKKLPLNEALSEFEYIDLRFGKKIFYKELQ